MKYDDAVFIKKLKNLILIEDNYEANDRFVIDKAPRKFKISAPYFRIKII